MGKESTKGKVNMVKEVKGGTFSPADYPVIKRALQLYIAEVQRIEGYSDRDPHPD